MIDLHAAPTPNGWKVSLPLEALDLASTVNGALGVSFAAARAV
jgi:hypothetical protein